MTTATRLLLQHMLDTRGLRAPFFVTMLIVIHEELVILSTIVKFGARGLAMGYSEGTEPRGSGFNRLERHHVQGWSHDG